MSKTFFYVDEAPTGHTEETAAWAAEQSSDARMQLGNEAGTRERQSLNTWLSDEYMVGLAC